MRSGLLSSSRYGAFYEDNKTNDCKVIQLHKVQELTQCKITLKSERLYLLDTAGRLTSLNLKDKSVSTLEKQPLQHFHPDSTPLSIQATARYL